MWSQLYEKKLKEHSSLTISTEPSNDNDSNKEVLNINKVLPTIIENGI